MVNVFIIGAKSIGQYGGFETFVKKLIEYQKNEKDIQYYIFCKKNGYGYMPYDKLKKKQIINDEEFMYNNAYCYRIQVPQIGSAQAIYYHCVAFNKVIKIIQKNNITNFVVFVLGCSIGIFFKRYVNKIHKYGGKVYINPDGHEWKRNKWNTVVKKYFKLSEKIMVKYSDLVVCDSVNIEKYIHNEYDGKHIRFHNPKTIYIPYGADEKESLLDDNDKTFKKWLKDNEVLINEYYLVIGRFVLENNYGIIIKEFMKSDTKKKLVIITNINRKLYNFYEKKYHFKKDSRIKIINAIYEEELIKKIREKAFAYIHGHSVGGTNPSLLDALSKTKLNLLYDCIFNREVAGKGALYWNDNENSLCSLMCDYDEEYIKELQKKAKEEIEKKYKWKHIVDKYKKIFIE